MAKTKLEKDVTFSKLSYELYLNSRVPISELVDKLMTSHQTTSRYIKELEKDYGLDYTIDIDTTLLGFTEARIFAIKFDARPEVKTLKNRLIKDHYVQNAYLATGDFDLILHVICTSEVEYIKWLFKFRVEFSNYRSIIKVATLNDVAEGFMPIRNELIKYSNKINETEKKIMKVLLSNSRIRQKSLIRQTNITQMRVIYVLKKLVERGIIRRFTATIQNPNNKIFLFFALVIIPNQHHKPQLQASLIKEIINRKEVNQLTTDYSVVYDTSGHFDSVFFCNFKDGASLDNSGPNLFNRVWESEYPKIEKAILTDLVIGKWPFNNNAYKHWEDIILKELNHPTKYNIIP